jgi:carboxyl-terminal processing protease
MPKRNLLLLSLITVISLVAWLARDHGRHTRQVGEVIAAIDRAYLERIDPDDLAAAALDGVMAKLDEHSALVDGAARRELEATLDQEFGGVGLELASSSEGVTVHSPVAGGPAGRAGIEAGDVIVSIDGIDARRLSVRDAVAILRGDPGSRVVIGVRRPAGAECIDGAEAAADVRMLTLTREMVRTESVLGDRRRPDGAWEWIVEGEPGIAHVRITSFGERTAVELDAALEAIAGTPGLRGLVLDLRGNPGGLLSTAVDVCDRFLDDGVIVATRRRTAGDGVVVEPRRAVPGSVLVGVPIAVLIDGLTASAAEIVAGCLQDHGRAVVVGSRSFGKGTVQSILPLSDGRRLLKLTTAEYLRPSEMEMERRRTEPAWSVAPDAGLVVDVTGRTLSALQAWRRPRDSAPPAGRDHGTGEPGSAGDLPRFADPVLAAALGALASPEAHLGGQEEAARDADEAGAAGATAGDGEGFAG